MATWPRPRPHTTNKDIDEYKIEYIPLWSLGGVYTIAQDSDATVAAEDFLVSAGSGNPSFGGVTDSGIVGLHVDANGDDLRFLWPIPYDCDVKDAIDFAVMWSSDTSTATETVTWKILYTQLTVDTTTIDGAPATALNTAIAADYQAGTAWALQQTSWGTINGGTLTNGRVLKMLVELDADSGIDVSSDKVHGHYLVIRYKRRIL